MLLIDYPIEINYLRRSEYFGKKSGKITKVQVACPYCGSSQPGPPLALSTFCRNCGEHYKIENGVGRGRDGPKVSGLIRTAVKACPLGGQTGFRCGANRRKRQSPEKSLRQSLTQCSPLLPKTESKGHLLSGWLKRDTPKRSKIITTPKGDVIKKAIQPHEPEKRLVRCFDCNHRQWVPISAESTQCGRCSVYISMGDMVIKNPSSQNIRTRGDVTVEQDPSLAATSRATTSP
ncbi:MAG: hypothetical protein R3F31_14635 [Verrucomicrobiales bacterium]